MDSILVNNAGICEMRPFAMSTVETVWRQVEVNFKGVLCPPSPLSHKNIIFANISISSH
jgi:NAD(P)-dependent dehydrogenase (short-subunit alcohol dehydrogenase family)